MVTGDREYLGRFEVDKHRAVVVGVDRQQRRAAIGVPTPLLDSALDDRRLLPERLFDSLKMPGRSAGRDVGVGFGRVRVRKHRECGLGGASRARPDFRPYLRPTAALTLVVQAADRSRPTGSP